MSTSWTARAQRRGAISQREFLAEMGRLGFVEVTARAGFLHEFSHPDTRGLIHLVPHGDSYSRALERLAAEVSRLRQWSTA